MVSWGHHAVGGMAERGIRVAGRHRGCVCGGRMGVTVPDRRSGRTDRVRMCEGPGPVSASTHPEFTCGRHRRWSDVE